MAALSTQLTHSLTPPHRILRLNVVGPTRGAFSTVDYSGKGKRIYSRPLAFSFGYAIRSIVQYNVLNWPLPSVIIIILFINTLILNSCFYCLIRLYQTINERRYSNQLILYQRQVYINRHVLPTNQEQKTKKETCTMGHGSMFGKPTSILRLSAGTDLIQSLS